MSNGIYAGKQMASERSAYQSDRMSLGAVGYTPDEDVNAYREAFNHALRPHQAAARPRAFNLPSMIEVAALNSADMMSMHQRIARIAAVFGKHLPATKDGQGPTAPPSSALDQLDNINNVQRETIASVNMLLTEIEQALGI